MAVIIGHNALAVARAKAGNMLHSLLDGVHNLHGQTQIAVLRSPVLLRHRHNGLVKGLHTLITADFHAGLSIFGQHGGHKLICYSLMHQQRFHSVAHGRTLHLSIIGDFYCHFHISAGVNVGVAYPCTGFDNGYGSVHHHHLNQACATAGNNHIHKAIQMNQILHGLTVAGINKLNRSLRHACSCRCFTQNPGHRLIGLHGLAATLEHHGVAGFQAQACCIRRNIGTSLINNTNYSQGHPHLGNSEPISQRFAIQHIAHRVGQISHLTQAIGHALDACFGQLQAVQHGALHTLGSSTLHIKRIRR